MHDRYAYPPVAFRELIANALIHRDLDVWSAGLAIEVRLRRDRLVIANPGGLYGINVERLGRDPVTSPHLTSQPPAGGNLPACLLPGYGRASG